MAINKIMVLGAGTMGMGIAQVFAEAGKTVIVRDIADAFIQRGEGVLRFPQAVAIGPDGAVRLPERPGLGVALNQATVDRYRV